MAHEIEYRDDKYSYVENGKNGLAWHKLGVAYDRPLTAAEAIKGCRADYNVVSRPISSLTQEQIASIRNGEMVKIDPSQIEDELRAITREDTNKILSVASSKYQILQNAKAFEFVDYITSGELGKQATIDAAGVLMDGKKIFITAKFSESLKMPGSNEDMVDMYLVFTNGFDKQSPICCMTTPIRVVCNNTLNAAFNNNHGRIRFKHYGDIHSRLDIKEENIKHAASCLKIFDSYTQSLLQGIETLGNKKISHEQAENIIKFVFCPENMKSKLVTKNYDINDNDFSVRYKNTVKGVINSLDHGIGQEIVETGTGLWLFNGLTTAVQNHMRFTSEAKKFESLMDGRFNDQLNEATRLILAA